MVTVIMKGVRRNFSKSPPIRYRNPALKGKEYSLVSYGRCNLKCTFCFTAGDESDDQGVFPDAYTEDLETVKGFVRQEVEAGNPIRISGGEPALYLKETVELLELIHELGGFSIVDSNGTIFRALEEFAKYADVLSLDPLKGPKAVIEKLTGRPKAVSWDLGVKTTQRLGELKCYIEYKTMLFHPIDTNFLEFVYSILPKNVHWTLKKYLPAKHYFPRDPSQEMIRASLEGNGLQSPSKEDVIMAGEQLLRRHPDLKGRLTCIFGSTRRPENYRLF